MHWIDVEMFDNGLYNNTYYLLLDGANQSVISCHWQNHGASNICHNFFVHNLHTNPTIGNLFVGWDNS